VARGRTTNQYKSCRRVQELSHEYQGSRLTPSLARAGIEDELELSSCAHLDHSRPTSQNYIATAVVERTTDLCVCVKRHFERIAWATDKSDHQQPWRMVPSPPTGNNRARYENDFGSSILICSALFSHDSFSRHTAIRTRRTPFC
jgi:hypothetical protein